MLWRKRGFWLKTIADVKFDSRCEKTFGSDRIENGLEISRSFGTFKIVIHLILVLSTSSASDENRYNGEQVLPLVRSRTSSGPQHQDTQWAPRPDTVPRDCHRPRT